MEKKKKGKKTKLLIALIELFIKRFVHDKNFIFDAKM